MGSEVTICRCLLGPGSGVRGPGSGVRELRYQRPVGELQTVGSMTRIFASTLSDGIGTIMRRSTSGFAGTIGMLQGPRCALGDRSTAWGPKGTTLTSVGVFGSIGVTRNRPLHGSLRVCSCDVEGLVEFDP